MSKRILWIDDEIYKLESLVDVLREEDIEVTTADTVQQWKEELGKEAGYYDLVILDIGLTDKPASESYEKWSRRGEQFLERIKQQWPEVQVVIFTGILPSNDEKRIKYLGANAFLTKPVLLREFKGEILKQLGLEKERD